MSVSTFVITETVLNLAIF